MKSKEDVFMKLLEVLEMMRAFELENKTLLSEEAWYHLSLTMEHISGKIGITQDEIEKHAGSLSKKN